MSAVVAAQQPPPPPAQEPPRPTFRAGVSVVRVDVSVTGRKNEPIADLTAADFVLEDDGVVQTIDTCQFIRLTGERMTEREESLEIRSPEHAEVEAARDDVRLFALFLDEYHIDKLPQVTLPLRAGLTEFIDMLGPNDLFAIVDPLTPMSALKLTRDRFALKEVVRKFEGRQGEYFPMRSALEEEQMQSRNVRRVRAEVTLSALAGLVTRMGSLREGRKSVVFVSQGPPTMFGFYDMDIEDRMRDVFEAASRGNVTIHVVDPRGLGVEGRGGVRDTLYRLAGETGGRTVINTNNMVPGLREVVADASAYYLLGYAPTRDVADGKFHKIKVEVKRPGVDVLARKGYWAPSAAEARASEMVASRPEVPGVVGALAALADSKSARAIDTWFGRQADGGRMNVVVTWDKRDGSLDPRTVVAVDVEPLGPSDDASLSPAQRIVRSDAAEGTAAARFSLPAAAPVKFRMTATDATGAVVDRWTETLPPGERTGGLTLDDVRLYRALTPMALRTLRGEPSPIPTAARAFRRTDRILMDVVAHATGDAPVQLVVELLNARGDVLVALPANASMTPSGVTARIEVPVASLALGRYVIRVRATQGDVSAADLEAFDIVR